MHNALCHTALHCTAKTEQVYQWSERHYTALQCIVLYYGVLYYITVHCTVVQCTEKPRQVYQWSGWQRHRWLPRCATKLKLNKLTTPANPIDSKPANTSLPFPTNTLLPIDPLCVLQIYTYDRPDHKYGWLTNIWEGLMKSRNRQIRKSWNVNYSRCFALLQCFVDKTIDSRETLGVKDIFWRCFFKNLFGQNIIYILATIFAKKLYMHNFFFCWQNPFAIVRNA